MAQELFVVRNILLDEIREKAKEPDHVITLTYEQAQTLHLASEPPEFINCGTVCVCLLPVQEGLAVIRRGNPSEDGFGKLGLIGGFQEGRISEPLKTAACRELREEIGITITEDQLNLLNAETDDFHHNVIFYEVVQKKIPTFAQLKAVAKLDPEEVSELVLLEDMPLQDEVAFVFHYREIQNYFNGRLKFHTEFD